MGGNEYRGKSPVFGAIALSVSVLAAQPDIKGSPSPSHFLLRRDRTWITQPFTLPSEEGQDLELRYQVASSNEFLSISVMMKNRDINQDSGRQLLRKMLTGKQQGLVLIFESLREVYFYSVNT
nr:uncharacterized protein LOC105712022 [Aotus nancymaae]